MILRPRSGHKIVSSSLLLSSVHENTAKGLGKQNFLMFYNTAPRAQFVLNTFQKGLCPVALHQCLDCLHELQLDAGSAASRPWKVLESRSFSLRCGYGCKADVVWWCCLTCVCVYMCVYIHPSAKIGFPKTRLQCLCLECRWS